ncbi:M28 family peptidase [Agrobacterium vitis]|uniref:M28 family peptidase n=1 Tax=Agrobacterium vitis TaxID=373 RepID=A0ABW9TJR7_AGRVI|nr:M28 family peptidase [Agrobacterium vitis]MUO43029.1 M28 family peptidase [Agrobacterium vitis]
MSRVDPLFRDIEALAAFGPRLAGSPAERAAADYIAEELSAAGLSPDVITFDGYVSQPSSGGRVETADSGIFSGKGVAFALTTPPGGLQARLASMDEPGRFDGAIALAKGLPHHAVLAEATNRGAVAVIAISHDDHAHYWQISPLWGSLSQPGHLSRFATIPALQVRSTDGQRLEQIRKEGGSVRLFAETDAGWRRLSMPTVHIAGREPGYLLVGGHFCSWGPGASDNAAGNAVMLALARRYAQSPKPRFGLRIAWWTGHEQGGYAGSAHFSDLHHADLAKHAIGYMSVDNVGSRGAGLWLVQNTGAELAGFANSVRDAIAPPLSEAQQRFAKTLQSRADRDIPATRPARNGDQSFAGAGLPSLQVASWLDEDNPDRVPGTGLPWWWHTDEDTPDRCGRDVLEKDLDIHLALVDGLIDSTSLPLDPRAQADDLLNGLRSYRQAAPSIPALEQLETQARCYRDRLSASSPDEKTTLKLIKCLNEILFHALSATEFDMTRESRILPGLVPALHWWDASEDTRRMIEIRVARAANRIGVALDACNDLLDPQT